MMRLLDQILASQCTIQTWKAVFPQTKTNKSTKTYSKSDYAFGIILTYMRYTKRAFPPIL